MWLYRNKVRCIVGLYLNPSNYTKFVISSTVNCCTTSVYTQTIDETQIGTSEWSVQFPTDITATLTGLWFENVYTNVSFNALSTAVPVIDYSCITGDITNLFTIIEDWFDVNLGVTITQSYTYDAVTGICTYTISGLPNSIKPKYFEVLTSTITTYNYFTYLPISNGFFDSSSLLLSPLFYGMGNTFQDGVFTIELTYTTASGNIITEKNCFFLDCVTACTVSTKIKELEQASNEKNATNIFLLHYTLTEGSNCGCNCSELCEIFTKLCNNLNSSSCLCGCV